MKSLFSKLMHYGSMDMLPMHMPGHKRQMSFMAGIGKYDITEVTGFDDLHHPSGILREAMSEAAALYGSTATYFLVNGATSGILAAITAGIRPGEKLLMARNCHKSALNAVTLRNITPVWLYPQKCGAFGVDGSIDPVAVEEALSRDPEIRGVFLVSPTYEGVVSDIDVIAAIAHSHHLPLIVDGAHGAHFRFGRNFPDDALSCGADLVVESLHKTLPSLTQTALLHYKSNYVDREALEFALQTFQSSSPSYLLIASIIECLRLVTGESDKLFLPYYENLLNLRQELGALEDSVLLGKDEGFFDYDVGKIVLGFYGYGGKELTEALREQFHVEAEMAAPGYMLAMTSIFDDGEALFRLTAALKWLRCELPFRANKAFTVLPGFVNETVLTPTEARLQPKERIPFEQAVDRVSSEDLYLYPPGAPLVAAGERWSREAYDVLTLGVNEGFTVHGIKDGFVSVLK